MRMMLHHHHHHYPSYDNDDPNNEEEEEVVVRLVQTVAEAAEACARLRKCKVIALDMEGAPLERQTSLLQLAASAREVYVFDLLAFTAARQQHVLFDALHLLPILSDPNVLKLCYDGRGDGAALFLQHGVCTEGLYDLQVVFTSLFQAREDPCLKGLQHAIERVGVSPQALRAFVRRKRAVRQRWRTDGTDCILRRPLNEELLRYAAADVTHLFAMHAAWSPRVSERAVVVTSTERVRQHVARRQEAYAMYRLDFAPVRAQRPMFLVPKTKV